MGLGSEILVLEKTYSGSRIRIRNTGGNGGGWGGHVRELIGALLVQFHDLTHVQATFYIVLFFAVRIGFSADPDPALYLDANPDPWSHTNADPS
jgi:hypothetical protein